MKLAQILLACVTSCLITTSVSAQGFCVAENEGCRDIQTGKLYVPDGNKLVDPETKQVYLENQEVRSSVVSSGVGETSKTPSGGAFKGGVFDPSGTDALYAERAAARAANSMASDAAINYINSDGGHRKHAKRDGLWEDKTNHGAITHDPLLNQGGGGQGVDSAKQDLDLRLKAKRDYQKQQIPGFSTHQPTNAHERGVYKHEMNRQKNMDPNTWYR